MRPGSAWRWLRRDAPVLRAGRLRLPVRVFRATREPRIPSESSHSWTRLHRVPCPVNHGSHHDEVVATRAKCEGIGDAAESAALIGKLMAGGRASCPSTAIPMHRTAGCRTIGLRHSPGNQLPGADRRIRVCHVDFLRRHANGRRSDRRFGRTPLIKRSLPLGEFRPLTAPSHPDPGHPRAPDSATRVRSP